MRSQSCVISDRSHTVEGDNRFESPDQVHSFCAVVKGFARGLQFRGFGEAANWKQVFPLIFHFRSRKWQMSLSPRLRDGPGETVSSRSSPSPSSCSTSSAPSSTGLCAVALHTATLSGSGGRGTRGGKAVLCHACMHACVCHDSWGTWHHIFCMERNIDSGSHGSHLQRSPWPSLCACLMLPCLTITKAPHLLDLPLHQHGS